MREIKVTKTIEEVKGYEAFDGKIFSSEVECKKYESSAYAVIRKQLNEIAISVDGGIHNTFAECEIYENYGYGSEEFEYMIVDIKNEEDLRVVNQYYEFIKAEDGLKEDVVKRLEVPKEYIGKRVMINIGFDYDKSTSARPMTMDELITLFTKDIRSFFYPEKTIKEKKGNDNE